MQPKLLVKVIVVSPKEIPVTFPSELIEHTDKFEELQEETPLGEVKIVSSPISSIIWLFASLIPPKISGFWIITSTVANKLNSLI